jgi:hypothetical protein
MATMTANEPQPVAPPQRLRWYQFSLLSLLLAFPVVAWCVGTGIQGTVLGAAIIAAVLLNIKRKRWAAAGVIAGFLVLSSIGVGNSVEVRLDTGDQRFLFWGIPTGGSRCLRPELRDRLLTLDDPEVPSQWVWCATQVGSNNADAMVFGFYRAAASWIEVDPAIAKLLIRDISTYVRTTHATHGLPECTSMLFPDVVERNDGRYQVVANWRNNPDVQWYLKSKGYVERSPTPPP